MSNTAGSAASVLNATVSGANVTLAGRIRNLGWQTLGPFVVFAVMLLLVSIMNPAYLRGTGISIVTQAAAPILLVALGQAIVLNVGSIDLSNAAISLLGAILLALAVPPLGVGAPVAVLLLVTVFGAINGAIVAYAQVPSFALTLGTLGFLEAAALVTSGSETIYVTENRELITSLYQVRPLGVPLTFWIGVLFAILYWAMLRYTKVGIGMTAMGKNEPGAIFSAVKTRLLKVLAFAISGFSGGLAGVSIVAGGVSVRKRAGQRLAFARHCRRSCWRNGDIGWPHKPAERRVRRFDRGVCSNRGSGDRHQCAGSKPGLRLFYHHRRRAHHESIP